MQRAHLQPPVRERSGGGHALTEVVCESKRIYRLHDFDRCRALLQKPCFPVARCWRVRARRVLQPEAFIAGLKAALNRDWRCILSGRIRRRIRARCRFDRRLVVGSAVRLALVGSAVRLVLVGSAGRLVIHGFATAEGGAGALVFGVRATLVVRAAFDTGFNVSRDTGAASSCGSGLSSTRGSDGRLAVTSWVCRSAPRCPRRTRRRTPSTTDRCAAKTEILLPVRRGLLRPLSSMDSAVAQRSSSLERFASASSSFSCARILSSARSSAGPCRRRADIEAIGVASLPSSRARVSSPVSVVPEFAPLYLAKGLPADSRRAALATSSRSCSCRHLLPGRAGVGHGSTARFVIPR